MPSVCVRQWSLTKHVLAQAEDSSFRKVMKTTRRRCGGPAIPAPSANVVTYLRTLHYIIKLFIVAKVKKKLQGPLYSPT